MVMTCVRIPGGIMCMGGPDRKIRDQHGKEYTFEDHRQFGPLVLGKNGEVLDDQPGERASFWRAHRWWIEQGENVDVDGFCVWAEPAPTHKVEHIAGSNYRLVPL